MNIIVKEDLVSFKELEKKIFAYVCELGREITRIMLESYDKELAEGRDKKVYRGGDGSRQTSIKTVYGEVEYRRRVYRTENQGGQRSHVFLLDQAMRMDKIGALLEYIRIYADSVESRNEDDMRSKKRGNY